LRVVLKGVIPELQEHDVVIAKTAPFEFVSQLITAGTGARVLFVGQPKRFNATCFEWIVATPSTPSKEANIELELLPGAFTPTEYSAAQPPRGSNPRLYSFLIGGKARGYPFSNSDWNAVIELIKNLRDYDSSALWSISTSPRTDICFESRLKALRAAQPELFFAVSLWNDGQRVPVLDVLTGSSLIFVTEDSASMLCEALSTALPTISLRPAESTFHSLSTPLALFHEERGRLLRSEIDALQPDSMRKFAARRPTVPIEDWMDSLRRQFLAASESE
jgi:hypothetical protein